MIDDARGSRRQDLLNQRDVVFVCYSNIHTGNLSRCVGRLDDPTSDIRPARLARLSGRGDFPRRSSLVA